MTTITSNQAIYRTLEFDEWSEKDGLLEEERFLFKTYLDRNGRTFDAGTGGGRILFALRDHGFRSLFGFDYLPEFIEKAKRKDRLGEISFEVQDAADLHYPPDFFDQILYLQQILAMLESRALRVAAINNAYTCLRQGGIGIFSFLLFDVRKKNFVIGCFEGYLRLLRGLCGSQQPTQYMPWMRHGGKINWGAICDRGPYVYWFKLEEVEELLIDAGFQITAVGSSYQIAHGKMVESFDSLRRLPVNGVLYVVATK